MPIWCRIHIIISIKHCINFVLYEKKCLLFPYVVCHSYYFEKKGVCDVKITLLCNHLPQMWIKLEYLNFPQIRLMKFSQCFQQYDIL